MAAGEEAAYRTFHDVYVRRLSRYLLVLTDGDEHAMQEALQHTLSRLVRNIRVFHDEAVFWSWLTVLARSAHWDERKKRRRYLAFLDRFTRQVDVEQAPCPNSDPDERLGSLLRAGMGLLPEEERELLNLKYTERRSVREIALQSGMSEKAVESRLARIRLKLKAQILEALKNEAAC